VQRILVLRVGDIKGRDKGKVLTSIQR
jgi:hypothetical protein